MPSGSAPNNPTGTCGRSWRALPAGGPRSRPRLRPGPRFGSPARGGDYGPIRSMPRPRWSRWPIGPRYRRAACTFDDIDAEAAYDGVWANFSLLHAPRADLPRHLAALHRALRPDGLLHIGMKIGTGEGRDRLGRLYTYVTVDELRALVEEAGFDVLTTDEGDERGLAGTVDPYVTLCARRAERSRMTRIPRSAMVLGLAGLIPFLWGALTVVSEPAAEFGLRTFGPRFVGPYVGLAYGTVILSFMSGVLWGFATKADGTAATIGYTL